MSIINSTNTAFQVQELNQFEKVTVTQSNQTKSLVSNSAPQSQQNQVLTDLQIRGEAAKSKIQNAGGGALIAQNSIANSVNTVLTNKNSFNSLNEKQQRMVVSDLNKFTKTDSFKKREFKG
jgi:hypothetical protein